MNEAEEIELTREGEEDLGSLGQEATANLTRASLWNHAGEQVYAMRSTPDEITRTDSTTDTELWRRCAHPSQAPPWNQRKGSL
jgi:hypothetical protein